MKGSGFVLAGGRSRRMGRDKAQLAWGRQTLLERAIGVLAELGLEVSVVAAEGRIETATVRVLADLYPDAGPMAAVYTGLVHTPSRENYFIPCDMPRVGPELYRILESHRGQADLALCRDSLGRLHPLCAYYSRRCMPFFRDLIEKGRLRMEAILQVEGLDPVVLSSSQHGLPDGCFLNVNTPQEYERLLGESP